jgi:hypothetical protein
LLKDLVCDDLGHAVHKVEHEHRDLGLLMNRHNKEGAVSNSWMTCWVRGSVWSKHKSMKWSEREEEGLGRSSKPICGCS